MGDWRAVGRTLIWPVHVMTALSSAWMLSLLCAAFSRWANLHSRGASVLRAGRGADAGLAKGARGTGEHVSSGG